MRRWFAALLCLGLGACATAPVPVVSPATTPSQSASSSTLTAWRLSGRVSAFNGEDGWHASLLWTQQDDAYHLRFLGPLGQGGLELRGDAQGVSLRDSGGYTAHALEPESLVRQALGFEVPVSGLRYWVQGQAAPGLSLQDAVVYGAEGRPMSLAQGGWRIEYSAYESALGQSLPTRLRMVNGGLRLKLVVDRWEALDGDD